MKTLISYTKVVLAVAVIVFALPLSAKSLRSTITDTKVIKKTFDVNADAQFNLTGREADINITTWNQNKVEVTVTIIVEAFEQEELDKMLDALVPNITGSRTNVTVESPPCGQQETVIGNRRRIKMNNEVYKIKSYRFKYDIKMPATNHVNLKNRFGNVNMDRHTAMVDLELYECELKGSGINSLSTVANLRFTDGSLGSTKALDLKIYEGDVILQEATAMTLDCKFSNFNITRVQDANLSAYESNVDLGVTNIVSAKQNFGKLKIAEAKVLNLKSYELKLEAGQVETLNFSDCKFSKFSFGQAGKVTVTSAYECTMTIGQLQSITIDAKFSTLNIGQLETSVVLTGYESSLNIGSVSKNFTKLSVDGKFCSANINLSKGAGYTLNADLSFGSLQFPKENMENLKVNKEGNKVSVSGKTRGYNGNTSISLKGYETSVNLTSN
ncbi:hypothetical protein [Owenweeksia hongkongensis]|uniref:hypothetical protein n=1 Tax=Owenweeksia hongkongensis TaxID=253245 RepID=UPI003A91CB42